MTPPELVIFDCDGVLVDTETVANHRLSAIIAEHGLDLTMAECRKRFMGRTMKSVRDMLLEEEGIDLGADFPDRWLAGLPELFSAGVEAIPHVREVILYLNAIDTPYCVASSAKVEKMHLTLGVSGLLPLLEDVLYSAWMVEKGKPAPDLFLFAASELGHAPERCAVIEDSPAGALAGKTAGMRVFGYTADPLTDAEGLADAGAVLFDDMRTLPALLGLR